ncbi:MAG: YfhO family protein, partial [Verrucomicrobia bacterium]|nr:YfhO family protein [Verrucomicrobiota bacterium]
AGTSARVLAAKWSAHRIECDVDSAAPTLVVIAQTFYHPWKATVNGQPTEILRANHAFQAVPVPAGRSAVRLEYVDRGFQLGVMLSALGIAACVVLWWCNPSQRLSKGGPNVTESN